MCLIGRNLRGHYQIIQKIGSGNFGDTYLAQDMDLPENPRRVVKHLRPRNPDPENLSRAKSLFTREAEALYKLGNITSEIPTLFAYFEEDGEFYLVQEFIDGDDLSQEIIQGIPKSEDFVFKLLQDILKVLVIVHDNNNIHRDIKPQNLIRRRADQKIVIIDFGAVKEINTLGVNNPGEGLTVNIGTPGYKPSEQAIGSPMFSSDIYAVGMLCIQALTGISPDQLPQDSDTKEIIWRDQANVSDSLASFLDKMVLYDFRQRYQSATEALNESYSVKLTQPPINTSPPAPIEPGRQGKRRRIIEWIAMGGGTLVLAVVARKIFVDSQGNAKSFTEKLDNSITLEMVEIPAGSFQMGAPSSEKGSQNNERPQHLVTVTSFFMGKYEVTQSQYEQVMGKNPSYFQGARNPVYSVSWNDAQEFCRKLSQKTRKAYRLPSEAEWEYACRAGTTTPFYFGETITTELANYDGSSQGKGEFRHGTTEVGTFPPNAFGLYDMHGNVWEWCEDDWQDDYRSAPVNGSAWISASNNNSQFKSIRGGCWSTDASQCRSAFRKYNIPDKRIRDIGFRVVCVVP